MKVTTFLWFDDQAEAAAELYCSLIPNSKITEVARMNGKAFTVAFELDGQRFMALNGGPTYQLTPATSLFVNCKDQDEIDRYWDALLRDGGEPSQCGWLVDRFGLSWQIIPEELPRLIRDPRGQAAMMTMAKIDLAALRAAVAPA
jgi:predicted 3-demethylubiquinone-9 3-methyltransferase (glyoxalase superfamily)